MSLVEKFEKENEERIHMSYISKKYDMHSTTVKKILDKHDIPYYKE
ncbi:hypothetical protein HOH45_05480 [bacterium]|nr:hypothetical protein [bacterium]